VPDRPPDSGEWHYGPDGIYRFSGHRTIRRRGPGHELSHGRHTDAVCRGAEPGGTGGAVSATRARILTDGEYHCARPDLWDAWLAVHPDCGRPEQHLSLSIGGRTPHGVYRVPAKHAERQLDGCDSHARGTNSPMVVRIGNLVAT